MISGIVAGQALAAPVGTADPYFSSVTALLHLNGVDGGTSFPDVKGATWSRIGTPTTSTDHGEFGSSLKLNGTNQALSTGSAAGFNLGSGDWTIEATVYLTSYSASFSGTYAGAVIAKDKIGAREWYLDLSGTASSWTAIDFVGFDSGGGYTIVSKAFAFSLNTEYKLRVCRSGSTVYVFVNGVLIHTQAFSLTIAGTATPVRIGALGYVGVEMYLPAHVWEVRITKGVARSTANYTPSAEKFPNF